MTQRYDITVVGEIFNDHVFSGFAQWPRPGEEVFAERYIREIGGGAAITSCALARLGRRVAVVGVIGKSDEWSRKRLHDFGVATDGLKPSALDTAVTVSISTSQDRSFFTWAGANRELPEHLADSAVQRILLASRHVHFAMRLDRNLASALLPLLHDTGCGTSIDPGFHPDWYRLPENRQTLGECDYFFPNQNEGELITGRTHPQEIMSSLHKLGIRGAVLKLGRRGAAAARDGKLLFALPPPMHTVDTTGAGDAFDAGFIDSILDDPATERALRRGCACGALSTRSAGGIAALPAKEELDAMDEQVTIGDAYGE